MSDEQEVCANCGKTRDQHLLWDGNKCSLKGMNGWFPNGAADAITRATKSNRVTQSNEQLQANVIRLTEGQLTLLNKVEQLEERNQQLQQRVGAMESAMCEAWKFAIHGTGTKCKDTRGKQFGAIMDILAKAYPSIADAALSPPVTTVQTQEPAPPKAGE